MSGRRFAIAAAVWTHRFRRWRLALDRWLDRGQAPRVLATACWSFPIYSQTFVYQELTQLMASGARLRFVYCNLEPRDHLPAQSAALWPRRVGLVVEGKVGEDDMAWFQRTMPDRVASLMRLLSEATGWSPERIRSHHHVRQAFSFARLAAAYRPDYLHSYFFYEGTLFCLVASHLLGIPRGVSAYADHLLDDYELKVMPLHLEQASLLIATSQRIKEELLSLGSRVDPERILVKPNAIDAKRFVVPTRRFGGTAPRRLLAVSRIDPKKGLTYLVEAVSLLARRGVNVELSLVGAADDAPAGRAYAAGLDEQIAAAGAGHLFRRLGFRTHEEVRSLLATAEVWVASAVVADNGDKDGIPTALLEAMAAGLPIVTTDAGSILEVVEDGVNALVVPQKDPVALADAIERMLSDPDLAERLGRAAVERVQAEFDVVGCEARFHRRLAEVLAR